MENQNLNKEASQCLGQTGNEQSGSEKEDELQELLSFPLVRLASLFEALMQKKGSKCNIYTPLPSQEDRILDETIKVLSRLVKGEHVDFNGLSSEIRGELSHYAGNRLDSLWIVALQRKYKEVHGVPPGPEMNYFRLSKWLDEQPVDMEYGKWETYLADDNPEERFKQYVSLVRQCRVRQFAEKEEAAEGPIPEKWKGGAERYASLSEEVMEQCLRLRNEVKKRRHSN